MNQSLDAAARDEAVVKLLVEAPGVTSRSREPITCGIPWPQGHLRDPSHLSLHDERKERVPLQVRVLDRWPDGSARWTLLDWQATVAGSANYLLRKENVAQGSIASPYGEIRATASGDGVVVETGRARFQLRTGESFPFDSIHTGGDSDRVGPRAQLTVENESGRVFLPVIRSVSLEESGPLRANVRLDGTLDSSGTDPLGEFTAFLHFFAGSATVRFCLTLRNPRRADHPGGCWDLGNGGSVYLKDAALTITMPPGSGPAVVQCSPEIGTALEAFEPPLELYQDSSGGSNWRSTNHINRHRIAPHTFPGYRLRGGGSERTGRRATPIACLERAGRLLAVAMPYFWQNFPKAFEATGDALVVRLFPRQSADVHEIQGGEQKTHEWFVAFNREDVTEIPLAWCREPLRARAEPEWYCSTGAISYLTPRAEDPNTTYLQLVDAAIEGEDTFERKREIIDEYGWRHFGDIYGDHEAVFHQGPSPLVSHYNNQYDPVAGFAYQFLRSGDWRWWAAMRELAAHVIDIDVYHTDRDRSYYNHGLFWHTCHYVDADTSTHRTYPRAKKVNGGGPSGGHLYATGLMLNYFLTGDLLSRQTAVELAQYVIDSDDGRKTIFRWLDRGPTGHTTASSMIYHGPGRAPANSVNALLDGHRLTGERRFLDKAEELIRRCIHPADDLAARNLLDAENKWFYTMFLQALGRYLDYKAERGELDTLYAYARESLLHYARWMADHEYPFLDKPEKLEYPTETWAAQDMRKSEVFKYAARHASGEERLRFLERADFFFRYTTITLAGMKTRTLARPVVLLLSYGFMHAYFQRHREVSAPPPSAQTNFGRPQEFVPQKVRAIKRFMLLAGMGAVAALVGIVLLIAYLLH